MGDKRLPLLPQWFFNIGLKYEREREREREREKEREGRCLFFFDKKKVGVFLREAKACWISFSNLTFELIPKRI